MKEITLRIPDDLWHKYRQRRYWIEEGGLSEEEAIIFLNQSIELGMRKFIDSKCATKDDIERIKKKALQMGLGEWPGIPQEGCLD